jgi:DNA repair exonuclease SbcCD ATPase subunit
MKLRGQMVTDDGFDKNVADKMPKVKKEEEFSPPDHETEIQVMEEDHPEMIQEVRSPEKEPEREVVVEPRKIAPETDKNLDVSRLIEDLHNQLLAIGRTKRALEMDLASNQKTIHQLAQDNRELRSQLADSNKEVQSLKEVQAEAIYLKEENADALERIQEFQKELKAIRETLELTTRERGEAQSRIQDLESQIEQSEILRVKGKMKEREASLFAEENRELRTRLEEVLSQNMDLERKYGDMRQSFHEVKESLTLLRDSCKTDYYNL